MRLQTSLSLFVLLLAVDDSSPQFERMNYGYGDFSEPGSKLLPQPRIEGRVDRFGTIRVIEVEHSLGTRYFHPKFLHLIGQPLFLWNYQVRGSKECGVIRTTKGKPVNRLEQCIKVWGISLRQVSREGWILRDDELLRPLGSVEQRSRDLTLALNFESVPPYFDNTQQLRLSRKLRSKFAGKKVIVIRTDVLDPGKAYDSKGRRLKAEGLTPFGFARWGVPLPWQRRDRHMGIDLNADIGEPVKLNLHLEIREHPIPDPKKLLP